MTVTSAPIGSTGQSLDGFAVNANVPAAFRESVVITDPTDPIAAVQITSTQPIGFYGVPVWIQGSPSIVLAGTSQVQVLNAISTFPTGTTQVSGAVTIQGTSFVNVVSSIPLVLASQISSFVTNQLTTTNVNVISTVPHTIVGTSQVFGTVSSQVVSSIPVLVTQSTSPWVVSSAPIALTGTSQVFGTVSTFPTGVTSSFSVNNVSTYPTVNVTNVPAVNITSSIPFFVAQSSAPWSVNISTGAGVQYLEGATTTTPTGTVALGQTTSNVMQAMTIDPSGNQQVNVVSSLPFFVTQSSAPWAVYEIASTQTNTKCTSVVLLATLNTTVIKAGPGVLTAYQMSNFSSTSVYVKLANASSAVIASTAMFMQRIGLAPSTTIYASQGIGMNFSTGICMFTTRNAFDSDLTAPLGSSCVVNLCFL